MPGASFLCILAALQRGLVKNEGVEPHKTKRSYFTVPHPQYLQLQHHCCFNCWIMILHPPHVNQPLLRTLLKRLQFRKETLCKHFRLSPGICLMPSSLPPMQSSPSAHHLSPTATSILPIAQVTCHDSAAGILSALISWVGNTGQCYF